MTTQVVAERGVQTYSADLHRVFLATVGALKTLGYGIAFADEAAGIIKTSPKVVSSGAHSERGRAVMSPGVDTTYESCSKLYAVQLSDVNGQTRVELTPRLFHNNEDISAQPIWQLNIESNAWRQMFLEIGSNLGPTSPPPPDAPPAPVPSPTSTGA